MKKLIIYLPFLLIFQLTADLYAQSRDSFPETEIILEKDAYNLRGTLIEPAAAEPHLVVIISGSGPTDRDGNNESMKNNSLKFLAEALFKEGLASFRFDKRGIAGSASAFLNEADMVFEDFSEDVADWIRLINKEGKFKKVSIIGHSEGALIGTLAAQKTDIYRFVYLAGQGFPIDEILKEQLKDQPPMVKEAAFPILDSLKAGKTVDNVNPMLSALFRPSVQPYLISWMKYDPVAELAKVDAPVLIIQGDKDIQVSVENAHKLHAGVTSSKLEIIEGMNHVLKPSGDDYSENLSTYNNPELSISTGLVEKIAGFLKN